MRFRNTVAKSEEKPLIQLFFLKNNEDPSIEVFEVEEIDFTEVKKRLEREESVFITRKRKQKLDPSQVVSEDVIEPWYFPHV